MIKNLLVLIMFLFIATIQSTFAMSEVTQSTDTVEAGRVCIGSVPSSCFRQFEEIINELEFKCSELNSSIATDVSSNIECSEDFEKCSIVATTLCK